MQEKKNPTSSSYWEREYNRGNEEKDGHGRGEGKKNTRQPHNFQKKRGNLTKKKSRGDLDTKKKRTEKPPTSISLKKEGI